jgi:MFS transporter, DHA1 family, inner membrane transport protein
MAFFKNRNINLLNLHTSLHKASTGTILMFGAIYLLQQGLSLKSVIIIWSLNFIVRILARPISFKLSQKIGIKKALIFGVIFYSFIYFILFNINGINHWITIFLVYFGLSDIFYWLPYHVYYARIGENENRGKHLGIRETSTMLLTSLSPILGGILIDNFGFKYLYIFSLLLMYIGLIPLFYIPEINSEEKLNYKKALKQIDKRGFFLLFGDGFQYYSHQFLWTIILFKIVNGFTLFGSILGFQIIITGIIFIILGHYLDKGKNKLIVNSAIILMFITILGRIFIVKDILTIIIFEVIFALSFCFYISSMNTGFYNISKKTNNSLWFHFFGEMGWDIGSLLSLSTAYILLTMNIEIKYIMLISIFGFITFAKVLKSKF